MIINDEKLSAYLDNELSEQDRAQLEARLRDDVVTADRLAQLTRINALLGKHAAMIDALPVPESVMAMLRSDGSSASASNVVELSRFRQAPQRMMQVVREHAALAASLALLLGFAGGQILSTDSNDLYRGNINGAIFAALDSVPSGQQLIIDTDTRLTARFSFQDTQSRFCRQYVVYNNLGSSENLACRDQDEWTLVASALSSAVASSAQYQPASGPRLLDNMLDAMMQGSALSQDEEQTAISNEWQTE